MSSLTEILVQLQSFQSPNHPMYGERLPLSCSGPDLAKVLGHARTRSQIGDFHDDQLLLIYQTTNYENLKTLCEKVTNALCIAADHTEALRALSLPTKKDKRYNKPEITERIMALAILPCVIEAFKCFRAIPKDPTLQSSSKMTIIRRYLEISLEFFIVLGKLLLEAEKDDWFGYIECILKPEQIQAFVFNDEAYDFPCLGQPTIAEVVAQTASRNIAHNTAPTRRISPGFSEPDHWNIMAALEYGYCPNQHMIDITQYIYQPGLEHMNGGISRNPELGPTWPWWDEILQQFVLMTTSIEGYPVPYGFDFPYGLQ